MEATESKNQHDVQCRMDHGFFEWMANYKIALAVTTYQAGKLLFVGWNGQTVSLHARNFGKAMGLDVHGDQLAIATGNRIHWFSNDVLLAPDCVPEQPNRYDSLYLLRSSHYTGPLFVHDLAFAGDELWFVNTRFSCLATLDNRYNFVPRWQPAFISELSPFDHCHLNGLAVHNNKPQTVTALGTTDSPRGWKANKDEGGVVIDIPTGEIIVRGLAMPHSPRWYNNQLWFLDSGRGELKTVDSANGKTEIISDVKGYLRGLAFYKHFALIGLCKIREKAIFGGVPVERQVDNLLCGIAIIDTQSGQRVGLFEFTAGVEEIYDIRVLPDNITQPNLLHEEQDKFEEAISTPDFSYWIQTKPDIADAPASETEPNTQ